MKTLLQMARAAVLAVLATALPLAAAPLPVAQPEEVGLSSERLALIETKVK